MPNFRAQKFSPTGQFLLQAPSPAAPPPPGGFALPSSAALDAAGNIFVIDSYNWRVQKLASTGTFIKQWGRRGGASDQFGFQYPRGIAVDRNDGSVIVADTDNSVVKKYTNDGAFLWKSATTVKAFAVDVAADGSVYAPDFQANNIKVYNGSTGALLRTIGAGEVSNSRGVAVDSDGSIWVSNRNSGKIVHLSSTGTLLGSFGSAGTGDSQLSGASDIEVDTSYVYVADQTANRIKVWTRAGEFALAYGGGGSTLGRFQGPMGLDLTSTGRLYVTEFTNERVQELSLQ